jgi:hypothetical protein
MILYVNQRKRQNFYGFRKFTHIIFEKFFIFYLADSDILLY